MEIYLKFILGGFKIIANGCIYIIQNIPKSINKRLSEISIDKNSINQSASLYQKALDDSGYHHHLTFTPSLMQSLNSTRRNCRRNVIWYNPPFSKNVATNVGRMLLKILYEEFPESHVLHKIFNLNTVKISYSCMLNLKQIIDGRNKSILQKTTAPPIFKACNCRRAPDCLMAGNCLTSSLIYQATVTTEDSKPDKTYVRPRLKRNLPTTNLLSTTSARD